MRSVVRTLTAAAISAASLLAAGESRATVVCTDLQLLVIPPSGALHLGSLITASIGLGASGGRRGWYNAAIATVVSNYVASAAVIGVDAATTDCYGARLYAPSMVAEGIALAGTTGLLVAVVLTDPVDLEEEALAGPTLTAAVVPRGDGTLAVLGGTF